MTDVAYVKQHSTNDIRRVIITDRLKVKQILPRTN